MTKLPYRLDFSQQHLYSLKNGITIPITLISDRTISTDLFANLDTGTPTASLRESMLTC